MKVILTIQRLTLREFISSDAALMYELNNDPEVIKFTGDQRYDSLEQAALLVANDDKYDKVGYGRWSVILNTANSYLGWCGLSYDEDAGETALGFRFLRKILEQWVRN
ncbi:MAG: GNAT family N-acetyltransferase [Chryseolinea sp.]